MSTLSGHKVSYTAHSCRNPHRLTLVALRHLATCSADSTVKIWSTANYDYTLIRTLQGHQRWVWDAAFSADSAYLVTGELCFFVFLSNIS